MSRRLPSVDVTPAGINFRPTVETRERAPNTGAKGNRAFIYDIEGERLTAKEIAARLKVGLSTAQGRLAKGQRTWAALRENKTAENIERQKRYMKASLMASQARSEAFKNGRKA